MVTGVAAVAMVTGVSVSQCLPLLATEFRAEALVGFTTFIHFSRNT